MYGIELKQIGNVYRMNVTEALLESWDRQARIVEAVAGYVNETNRNAKPSEDGWPLDVQLAHIHKVRAYFLTQVAPEKGGALPETFTDGWDTSIADLDEIKAALVGSKIAVREAVLEGIETGATFAGYDHPVLFLQHLVWHEGWHVGLIFLALRRAGQEIPQEWEEQHVWSEWRTEIW